MDHHGCGRPSAILIAAVAPPRQDGDAFPVPLRARGRPGIGAAQQRRGARVAAAGAVPAGPTVQGRRPFILRHLGVALRGRRRRVRAVGRGAHGADGGAGRRASAGSEAAHVRGGQADGAPLPQAAVPAEGGGERGRRPKAGETKGRGDCLCGRKRRRRTTASEGGAQG